MSKLPTLIFRPAAIIPWRLNAYLDCLWHPIQYLLNLFLATAAQAECRSVCENDGILTAGSGLHLSDLAEIDNRRAVNAAKLFRVKLHFHLRHRFAEQVRLAADVQTDVIVSRFDPVYLLHLDEKNPAGRFDQKLLLRFRLRSGRGW